MQRKRGELVPIGEVVSGLDDALVPTIRDASPQARHHFTQADQVNQLVSASEADPDLGFMALRRALFRLGYRYRLHRRDLPGSPDLVFLSLRKTIFVHGCFWHGHECSRGNLPSSNVDFWQAKIQRNRERDSRSQKQLRRDGWEVLTVWECETKNEAALVKRVCRFLGKGRNNKRANKESFLA